MARPRVYQQPHPLRRGDPLPAPFQCHLQLSQCVAQVNGRRCLRHTIRNPLCYQHVRSLIGLEPRVSPHHGCGLFATVDLKRGDVLLPYTGEMFPTAAAMRAAQGRGPDEAPYTAALGHGGPYIESSCLRGWVSYANASRCQRDANARIERGTLRTAMIRPAQASDEPGWSYFRLPGRSTMRVRPSSGLQGHGRRVRTRAIPLFKDVPSLWLIADRPIPMGTEIRFPYPLYRGIVRTTPPLCHR